MKTRLVMSVVLCLGALAGAVCAAETPEIKFGKLSMSVPAVWKKVAPKNRIIEHEFAAPGKGDDKAGRLTAMPAGGDVDVNLKRWYGQFTQPDGTATEKRAKVEKKEVAGATVHFVDISGTFSEPTFDPGQKSPEFKNYRMIGAIIISGDSMYFLKFYGPETTMAEHAKAFKEMVTSMKAS